MNAEEMLREFMRQRESSPFSHWQSASNFKPGDFVPGGVKFYNSPAEPPPPPVDWKRATALGFLGAVAAAGYQLRIEQRRAVGTLTGDVIVRYAWRAPGGGTLTGTYEGDWLGEKKAIDHVLEICAKLASWERQFMHWRTAFREIGINA